jgi:hypothetical protein
MILNSIGVTGEPVDPGIPFEKLGDIDPIFLSGAIQPLTLRAIATMLISAMPAAERAALGAFFMSSGDAQYAIDGDDWRRSAQAMRAMDRLARVPSASLDSYPDAPLFYIHMGASQRTIVHDVEDFVRRWKRRHGITERRFHTEKLPLYLQVWDLREGWTGDRYDRAREQTLKQISRQFKVSVSTTASRYNSAFQLITGHDFSMDLWRRLLGPLKLSGLFVDAEAILAAPMRRRLASPIRREVPDSVVTPKVQRAHSTGLVENESARKDGGLESLEVLWDAEDLMARGLSDEEIAERLGVSLVEITYIRDRTEEFRQIQHGRNE